MRIQFSESKAFASSGLAAEEIIEMTDISFVTVITPMYNEKAHISECLNSLIEQDYPPSSVEVLVVDGMSDDGSRDIVREFIQKHPSRKILMLDNPRRIPAAAMNIGIREAQGDVIIRLDAHSLAASDFISKSVAYLSKTKAACVGGLVQSIARCSLGQAIALAMSSPFGVGDALYRYAQKEQYVDTVLFGAYHKTVFEEIGLFDEELIYSEDNEFNHRLRERGGKIFLTPEIRAFYYTRESLKELWRQYYHYGFGKVKLMARSPDSILIRHLLPSVFVSILLISGLLGIFNSLFRWLFLLVLAIYLVASLFFSLRISARNGWQHLPVLPAAFACLHFGYGLGSLAGLLRLMRESRRKRLQGSGYFG